MLKRRLITLAFLFPGIIGFAAGCDEPEPTDYAESAATCWAEYERFVHPSAQFVEGYAQVYGGQYAETFGSGFLLVELFATGTTELPRRIALTVQRNEPWTFAATEDILSVRCLSSTDPAEGYGTRCWVHTGIVTANDTSRPLFEADGSPRSFLSDYAVARARQNGPDYQPLWDGASERDVLEALRQF